MKGSYNNKLILFGISVLIIIIVSVIYFSYTSYGNPIFSPDERFSDKLPRTSAVEKVQSGVYSIKDAIPFEINNKIALLVKENNVEFVAFEKSHGKRYLNIIDDKVVEVDNKPAYTAMPDVFNAFGIAVVGEKEEIGKGKNYFSVGQPIALHSDGFAFVARRDGQSFVVKGQVELSRKFSSGILSLIEVDGVPIYVGLNRDNQLKDIVMGEKTLYQYNIISELIKIGKDGFAFVAEEGGLSDKRQFVVFNGVEGKRYKKILRFRLLTGTGRIVDSYILDINEEPSYIAQKVDGGKVLVIGNKEIDSQIILPSSRDVQVFLSVANKPVYVTSKNGIETLIFGSNEYGSEFFGPEVTIIPLKIRNMLAFSAINSRSHEIKIVYDGVLQDIGSNLNIASPPFEVNGKLAFFAKDKSSDEIILIYNSIQIKLPFKAASIEFLIGMADLIFYTGDKDNKQVLVAIDPNKI